MTWKEFSQPNLCFKAGWHYRLWLGEAFQPSKYVEHCHSLASLQLLPPPLWKNPCTRSQTPSLLNFELHFSIQLKLLTFDPEIRCQSLNHSLFALSHSLSFHLRLPVSPSPPLLLLLPLPPPHFPPMPGFPLKICKGEQTNVVMSSNALSCWVTPCYGGDRGPTDHDRHQQPHFLAPPFLQSSQNPFW